ncbi:hypothetical protein KGA65_18995 [Ideonella sp. B7]|uniref:hypothetical protein n=1 Tax=Ideonella benzenivorans TaxID=2831643 RepID=UPI001CEDF39B|nr:hypothetical protein [Ideonella benzenivorans]MCA6218632.1 hypothetical protein [Ideonella benzenivorans]
MRFNFQGLSPLYRAAMAQRMPTIAFPLRDGVGQFVFLVFVPSDKDGTPKWSESDLFILLLRTKQTLQFRLLGRHLRSDGQPGEFSIVLDHDDERAFRAELNIPPNAVNGPMFRLQDLLTRLNAAFPAHVAPEHTVDVFQQHRVIIRENCKKQIADAAKIHLVRFGTPSRGAPREETLRKLYMLGGQAPARVTALVDMLRSVGWTAFWSDKPQPADKFQQNWMRLNDEYQRRRQRRA